MASLSYLNLKSASNLRDHEQKQRSARHRNALVLILDYLRDGALLETAETLLREAKACHQDISAMKVCDNMDLTSILLEYECGYLSRLQKKPKFIREVLPEEKYQADIPIKKKSAPTHHPSVEKNSAVPLIVAPTESKRKNIKQLLKEDLPEINGTKLGPMQLRQDREDTTSQLPQTAMVDAVGRMRAALETYENQTGAHELQDLAITISKEMFLEDPGIHWHDIKGMEDAKRLVKEAVVYPLKYPELFSGILTPWRGLLLTGPPGTGKTMLAKAVATECKTAFFNITASTVISKWRGESEKLVRILFDLARKCAPTCIFLDELDSLMGQRGDNNEHEGSRRMKTELLIQMDGLQRSSDLVFVLAASNLPWDLDNAMLRRLEKRVFVDLPNAEARLAMFSAFLPPLFQDHPLGIRTVLDYEHLAGLTVGYSGSDIKVLCKETAMRAIRQVLVLLDDDSCESFLGRNIQIDPIVTEDVIQALRYTKPVETEIGVARYQQWKKQFEAS